MAKEGMLYAVPDDADGNIVRPYVDEMEGTLRGLTFGYSTFDLYQGSISMYVLPFKFDKDTEKENDVERGKF